MSVSPWADGAAVTSALNVTVATSPAASDASVKSRSVAVDASAETVVPVTATVAGWSVSPAGSRSVRRMSWATAPDPVSVRVTVISSPRCGVVSDRPTVSPTAGSTSVSVAAASVPPSTAAPFCV